MRIILEEGKANPKKFFFVPLYLQFDLSSDLQHIAQFSEDVRKSDTGQLFQKGVTVYTVGAKTDGF